MRMMYVHMHPAACVSACVHVSGGMSCRSVTQSEAGVSRNVWLLWGPADEHVNREVSYGERETRERWGGWAGWVGWVAVSLGMDG